MPYTVASAAWQTAFEDFADVARQTEFRQFPRLWPDYMAFLGERYAEVLAECRRFVEEVDARPNVYFAEQSSTFTLTDARGAGMDYRLARLLASRIISSPAGKHYDRSLIDEAIKEAESADRVIIAMGDGEMSGRYVSEILEHIPEEKREYV